MNMHAGQYSLVDLVKQGYALLHQLQYPDALALARRLLDAYPGNLHCLVLASEAVTANGDSPQGIALIDQAIIVSGGDPFLKLKRARLLGLACRTVEFKTQMNEVAAVSTGNGPLLWQMGSLCYRNNLHADAVAYFEQARSLVGNSPHLLYELAIARFFLGDFETAEHDIGRMLESSPESGPALYLRSTLRKQSVECNHIADIRHRLETGLRNPEDEAAALYALAKELEDTGSHDDSFAALAAGARKKRATLRYDAAAECALLDEIRNVYTREAISHVRPGHAEGGPIFIVGMPRTGTTLAERILVQSGTVASAGELQNFGHSLASEIRIATGANPNLGQAEASLRADFARLGRNYLSGARHMAPGYASFIDKMPVNFTFCGMIHLALPDAKIIHLVRNPLDTCYAVFKTLFFNSYGFSYDLDELANYYIAYYETMRHWHDVMPGRILDVCYEDLVNNTETHARRMYDWCGLEWSSDALAIPSANKTFATASAAQVRMPVHNRSVGSAQRHRARLAPLVSRLSNAGIPTN